MDSRSKAVIGPNTPIFRDIREPICRVRVLLLRVANRDVLPFSCAGMVIRIPFGYEATSDCAAINYFCRNGFCHFLDAFRLMVNGAALSFGSELPFAGSGAATCRIR